jgi:glutathionyl-hydroquinone reductase
MGQFVEGVWHERGFPVDSKGSFVRAKTTFHQKSLSEEQERYHLYISLACPWAHRTLMTRKLNGLDSVISLSVVDPFMDKEGWFFSKAEGAIPDPLFNARTLGEIYLKADPNYTGRVTVPVLWDKSESTIVNNESREIMRMFNRQFPKLSKKKIDLCPARFENEIDQVLDEIYEPINNGVYRSGFAKTQEAYDEAVTDLFDALERWERHLAHHRFLVGDQPTEADISLFATLIRFDLVYVNHFKCNIKRIVDFPALWGFVRDFYQIPGVKETCHFGHIKEHYFRSHEKINPTRIVPKGPVLDFDAPHLRDNL